MINKIKYTTEIGLMPKRNNWYIRYVLEDGPDFFSIHTSYEKAKLRKRLVEDLLNIKQRVGIKNMKNGTYLIYS